jgi:hypothetical protein
MSKIDLEKMSFSDFEDGHRRLWDWLAEHPMSQRWLWPGWRKYTRRPMNWCFACEWMSLGRGKYPGWKRFELDIRDVCPVFGPCSILGDGPGNVPCEPLMDALILCASGQKRADLAAQMRDMPWTEPTEDTI